MVAHCVVEPGAKGGFHIFAEEDNCRTDVQMFVTDAAANRGHAGLAIKDDVPYHVRLLFTVPGGPAW